MQWLGDDVHNLEYNWLDTKYSNLAILLMHSFANRSQNESSKKKTKDFIKYQQNAQIQKENKTKKCKLTGLDA